MAKDMTRQCLRCGKMKVCTQADRIGGYCCGDCWTEDLTIHPDHKKLKSKPRDEMSPWQENVIRQLEDGFAC